MSVLRVEHQPVDIDGKPINVLAMHDDLIVTDTKKNGGGKGSMNATRFCNKNNYGHLAARFNVVALMAACWEKYQAEKLAKAA